MWFLNRIVNPAVRMLLRSRLHAVLSGRLVLLRITGRRSGRVFELPVGYREERDERLIVTVGAPERKRWWRNIAGPTPVLVVLRGRVRPGVARRVGATGASVRMEIDLSGG